MYSIELKNVKKVFGKTEVIKGLDLSIQKGERLILLGSSGCGKSTLLRLISGLESITSGELFLNGELANSMAPGDRNIAMVFQNYALFPHMDVTRNISYGLRISHTPQDEISRRVGEAVRILNLGGLEHRLPKELSGGQRQRVALARALVKQSDFFLLDEPLSNLDAQLRGQARKELVKIHEIYHQTMVYVTHDQIEAMTIGQRIAVVHNGCIQMLDTPANVYHRPSNTFVARFIGSPSMNLFDARLDTGYMHLNGHEVRMTEGWSGKTALHGQPVEAGIRPEAIVLSAEPSEGAVPVSVQYHEDYGSRVGYYFTVNGKEVISIMPEDILNGCTQAFWKVDPKALHFFDAASGFNIGYPE